MYLKQCEVFIRVEDLKDDIQEIIKSKQAIKKWAYILHDKDNAAPHYHIYLNFGNSGVDINQVAEWFKIREVEICKVIGSINSLLLYLTHGNDSQRRLYQYSPAEVVANFDFQTAIKNGQK